MFSTDIATVFATAEAPFPVTAVSEQGGDFGERHRAYVEQGPNTPIGVCAVWGPDARS